jgi:N-acetylglucosaminyldiphosphoundecaprenol N-acetyl-beta-D-mannosaminyltransferase
MTSKAACNTASRSDAGKIGEVPGDAARSRVEEIDPSQRKRVSNDFSREVYGVLGIPVDVIGMPEVLRRIESAATLRAPFLLSTPNLDFLLMSRQDSEFLESLLSSDLCPPDGMPIVWLARLLGAPIKARIAGSDIYDALKSVHPVSHRLPVFLFGGDEGVAASAAIEMNSQQSTLTCVGSLNPGFGSVEDISADSIIETINKSDADILIAALSAKKGQIWLLRNHHRLRIPVRAHLGAVMNFQAGVLKRTPAIFARCGIEWLWRIKEEPHLWRRYWADAKLLVVLLATKVLPLLWIFLLQRFRRGGSQFPRVDSQHVDGGVLIKISGDATTSNLAPVLASFQSATTHRENIVIDMSEVRAIDARFIGALLMLRKQLGVLRCTLKFAGVSSRVGRIIYLNGFGFLLASN